MVPVLLAVSTVTSTPTTVSASVATRQTILAEQPALLTIQTIPKATCSLRHATDKAFHLRFDADDSGIVRIHIKARKNASPIAVHLDCSGANGQIATFPIELQTGTRSTLRDSLPSTLAASPAHLAPGERLRPALDVKSLALPNRELIARGFPPRPDRASAPARYARWLKIVSRPFAMVNSRRVPHPEVSFAQQSLLRASHADVPTLPLPPPSLQMASSARQSLLELPRSGVPTLPLPPPRGHTAFNGTSGNWSGVFVTNPASQFYLAQADWNVPAVYSVGPTYSAAAEWTGLDNSGNDLVQSGSDSESYNLGWWTFTNYWMWIESLPYAPSGVPNFPISPGDAVSVDVFLADQFGTTWFSNGYWGNITPADNNVWFMLYNYTQGKSYWGTLPTPPSFSGSSAEYIIERPSVNGGTAPLALFGPTSMSNSWYADANYGQQEFWPVLCEGASPFDGQLNYLDMLNGGSGNLLDFVTTTAGNQGGPCNIVWYWLNWA